MGESIHASVLETEALAALSQATHVFIYALCFPNELAKKLETALLQRLPSEAKVYMEPLFFDRISTPPSRHRWGQAVVAGRRFIRISDTPFMAISGRDEM